MLNHASSSSKCAFQSTDGDPCKRWANRGSRFCNNHQPSFPLGFNQWKKVHPLAKLETPNDLFDVIRETLNATRQGRISPKQAYAVGYLAKVWLEVHRRAQEWLRDKALFQQMLPTLVDAESAAELDRQQQGMPLPVKSSPSEISHLTSETAFPSEISDLGSDFGSFPVEIDEEASTDVPPPPCNAAEAKAAFDAALAALPPVQLEPLESYPGYLERNRRPASLAATGPSAAAPAATPSVPAPAPSPSQISNFKSQIPAASSPSEISDLKSPISTPSAASPAESVSASETAPSARHQAFSDVIDSAAARITDALIDRFAREQLGLDPRPRTAPSSRPRGAPNGNPRPPRDG